MLPFGYDPKHYGGKIWWNENNPGMRAIWGSQADYDKHVQKGGTWLEYEKIVGKRIEALKQIDLPVQHTEANSSKKR